LYNKPNLLFLTAVRSYKLAKKIAILTPKIQGPTHTKRLEAAWKVSWREIEEKYRSGSVYTNQEIANIESENKFVLPDDLKRYLTTVSNDIWGDPFVLDDFNYDVGHLCEIPLNVSTFAGYTCPYVEQGFSCRNCSPPLHDLNTWYYWREGLTDDEWDNMPECNPNITRGMLYIGPNYDGRQDWIVINASDPSNYGTVWECNAQEELFYIADSFSDYLMNVLRSRIVRPRKVPIKPEHVVWANNIGPDRLVDEIHLNWDNFNMYEAFLGPQNINNNAAPNA
jgi:hypothetical protein